MSPFRSLATVAVLALVSSSALADGSEQAGRIFRLHKEAINRGDVTGALGYLTSDVQYVEGTACCPARPCNGIAEARRGYVEWAVAKKVTISPMAQDMAPYRNAYRTRVEITWPGIETIGGIRRIVGIDSYTVRLDRIDSLVFTPDMHDEQTALYFAAAQ